MLLLFLFISTLIITYVVEQPNLDSITEVMHELMTVIPVEWVILSIALIILTTLAYLLIMRFNQWLSSGLVKLVRKSRNV